MSRPLPPCPLCQQPLDESLESLAGTPLHHGRPDGMEGLVQSRDRVVACGGCLALVSVTRIVDGALVVSETSRLLLHPAGATRALEILEDGARSDRLWEALHAIRPREALLMPAIFAKVRRLFEDPIALREDAYVMEPYVTGTQQHSQIRTLRLASDVDADRAKPGFAIVRESDRVSAGTPIDVLGLGAGCIHAKHFDGTSAGQGYVRVPAWAVAPRS